MTDVPPPPLPPPSYSPPPAPPKRTSPFVYVLIVSACGMLLGLGLCGYGTTLYGPSVGDNPASQMMCLGGLVLLLSGGGIFLSGVILIAQWAGRPRPRQ